MEGFRSFKEHQVFKVQRESGLYFIGGKNYETPRLGSNGCGKSSIWDAVTWCLYGKTIRGLRGSVIKNWTSKSCSVGVELFKDGIAYTITRTQIPNSLTIFPSLVEGNSNEETVSQADIDKFLNLDYDKFLYNLIVGQFNATFLDLQPTEKLNLFSSIMDLSFWEQCSKTASSKAETFQKRSESLSVKKDGIRARVDDLRGSRAVLEAKSKGFEGDRMNRSQELNRQATALFQAINELETEEQIIHKKIKAKKMYCDDFGLDLERIQSNIAAINSQYELITTSFISNKNTRDILFANFNKWKSLKTGICPHCEQEVKAELASEHKNIIARETSTINKSITENEGLLAKLDEQRKANTDKQAEIVSKVENLQSEIGTLNKELIKLDLEKSLKTQELRQCRESIDVSDNTKNPYSELLDTNQKQLFNINLELEATSKSLEISNKDLEGSNFWVKGFKELRLWILSDALLALEIETSNALTKLGLMEWKLKFQIERETTTGSISKGFHVLVHPKTFATGLYVPFETWSGGETQRLKLASVRGLSSLISNYKGIDFNFQSWDEPSSYLSEEGIEDLIKFLHEEAIETNKVIYIIDQRHLESPYFKSVIQVEKTKDGSKIVEGE